MSAGPGGTVNPSGDISIAAQGEHMGFRQIAVTVLPTGTGTGTVRLVVHNNRRAFTITGQFMPNSQFLFKNQFIQRRKLRC